MTLDVVQCGEESPRRRVGSVLFQQPQYTVALPLRSLEAKQRFDAFRPSPGDMPWWRTRRIQAETRRIRLCIEERCDERWRAAHCADGPCQREDITPMTVGVKQALQACGISRAQRGFEPREPVVRDRDQIVRA